MGSDVYGKLFYGIILSEDEFNYPESWLGEHDGWLNVYLKEAGIERPDLDIDHDKYKRDLGYQEQWSTYWSAKYKTEHDIPCTIESSGSDGFYSCYLCVKESQYTSEWGSFVPVFDKIDPMWEFELKKFCEKTGLKYSQPQWYLTSKYF